MIIIVPILKFEALSSLPYSGKHSRRHHTPVDYQPPPPQKIPKLNDTNYRTWVEAMEAVLKKLDVWDIVKDPLPRHRDRSHRWNKRNELAGSEIHFACEPSQQQALSIKGIFGDTIRRELYYNSTSTNSDNSSADIQSISIRTSGNSTTNGSTDVYSTSICPSTDNNSTTCIRTSRNSTANPTTFQLRTSG